MDEQKVREGCVRDDCHEGERHDDTLSDAKLAELFSSIEDVRASEDLKASTMRAILELAGDEADEAQDAAAGGEQKKQSVSTSDVRASLRLVEPEPMPSRTPEASESSASDTTAYPTLSLEPPARSTAQSEEPELSVAGAEQVTPGHAKAKRSWTWRLKAAAAIVAVALVLGGTAYALPASHVTVSQGTTTFDLAVNVFGVTVDVSASDDAGKAALQDLNVRNKGYEEALELVLESYETHMGDHVTEDLSVKVDGMLAHEPGALPEGVARVVDGFVEEHRGGAEGSEGIEGAREDQRGDTGEPGDSGNSQMETPVQPDGASTEQPSTEEPQVMGPESDGPKDTGRQEPAEPSSSPSPSHDGGQPTDMPR